MTAATLVLTPTIQDIPLEQLEASRNNPRRTMDEAGLQELAASIREHGVITPLIVRPMHELDQVIGYEIVAGHRRSEAATLAGKTSVPCSVRELSDEEAAEIALIDNLQRVDVPAIEEAEAFGELLERLGSIPAVAAKVGKEVGHIAKRLKLRSLAICARDALRHQLITVDHALLLARLGEDEQNAALKWCLDPQAGSKKPVEDVLADRIGKRSPVPFGPDEDDNEEEPGRRPRWKREWEPESVQRLKEHIECESGVPLDRAPWPMDEDWLLPDVGSCLDCEKNTKANAPLFGDLDIGVAVCTDGGCFKAKVAEFVNMQIRDAAKAQAAAKNIPGKSPSDFQVLRVSWKCTSTVPRQLKDGGGVNPAQTFKDGQWEEATKKRCEYALPAVTVDWSDANNRGYMGDGDKLRKPGEVVQACIQPKCKVHPKSYEKSAGSSRREERVSPEETKKLAEQREFLQKTEAGVRDKLLTAILEKLDVVTAIRMVADVAFDGAQWRKHLLAAFPKIAGDRLEALAVFCHNFGRRFEANGYWLLQDCKLNRDGYFEAAKERPNVAKDRKEAWDLAKRLGLDPDAITVQHFAEVGIAPASDCLYPKGPKAEKAWKELRAKETAAKSAKTAPAPKKTAAKVTKAPATKAPAKKAAKKGGRK
jgi:ParB/RepB/Spo0J family partition protein